MSQVLAGVDVGVEGVFADAEIFADLVAALGDQEGPGVVEELDVDNNMVKVSVSALFGKQTTVELELDQVELAE